MLVYTTLAACAVLIAVIVYRYDLHAREPWALLLVAAAIGAWGMWAAGRVQVETLRHGGSFAAENWNLTMASVAAATEEAAKVLTVGLIAILFRRWFDEPLDGVVYGAFAGLGAALEESVMLLRHAEHLDHLPPMEPIRLTGHLVMGGIGGFGIGMAVVWKRAWPLAALATFAAAWVLHFLWDVLAFAAADAGKMSFRMTCFAIVIMVAGLVTFRWFVSVGWRLGQRLKPVGVPPVAGQ